VRPGATAGCPSNGEQDGEAHVARPPGFLDQPHRLAIVKADSVGDMPQWHLAVDQLARRYRAAISRIGILRAFTRATISPLRQKRLTLGGIDNSKIGL
jgi:hypothetical protein